MDTLENIHFDELFNALPDGVMILDTHTQLPILYNKAICAQLGYTKSEFSKLKIKDIDAQMDEDDIKRNIQRAIKQKRNVFETKHKRKDGKIVDVKVTALSYEINKRTFLLCTLQDITAQKSTQKDLRNKKGQFEVIFNKANCGIAYSSEAGKVLLCNEYFAQMLKYSREEILSMNFSDFTHPDDLKVELPLFKDIIEQKAEGYRLIKRYICKDKKYVWVNLAVSVIRDDEGIPVNYLAVAIDITKEKLLEEQLIEKEERFRDVAQASGEYIWEIDTDFKYTFLTQSFEDMLGYTISESIGKTPFSFMPDGERQKIEKYFIKEAAHKGNPFRGLIHKSLTKDKKVVWQKVNGLPILDKNNTIVGYRGAGLNITSEIEAQEELKSAKIKAEAANSAKTQFLANMSHEIRTPMNAIIGLGDILMDMIKDPKQKDILSKINSSSKMLLSIINDILDYSKIEAGKLDLENEEFSIEEILSQLKAMFETKVAQKELDLYFYPKGKFPKTLLGDKLRLTQVLTNLLSNAIKFTQKGEITLLIELLKENKNSAKILFSVKDSGIGIEKRHLKKIFKSFSQADSSTTRKYGGTGLGLAISKNIIKAMGSDIKVESQIGVGSEFSFILEFNLPQEIEKRVDNKKIKTKILIVDDQKISREILKNILKNFECDCDEAENGLEAIKLIKKADKKNVPYEILLIDWQMPLLNGTQTLRKLQNMYLNGKLKKQVATVFMISSYNKEDIITKDIVIDCFISKPVTPHSLHQAIMDAKKGYGKKGIKTDFTLNPILDGLNILVVEDNIINQEVIGIMLKLANINFQIANNGKEAVELFAKNPKKYDLILMDLQMPVMGGFRATKEIRNYDVKIPIIALTAAATEKDEKKYLNMEWMHTLQNR